MTERRKLDLPPSVKDVLFEPKGKNPSTEVHRYTKWGKENIKRGVRSCRRVQKGPRDPQVEVGTPPAQGSLNWESNTTTFKSVGSWIRPDEKPGPTQVVNKYLRVVGKHTDKKLGLNCVP